MFHKQQRTAKPWLYLRASIQHQAGHRDWFLSLAGLGLAEPWHLCMAFVSTGLSRQFVLQWVCGAVRPRCLCMTIPRAGNVSQSQMSMCGNLMEPEAA